MFLDCHDADEDHEMTKIRLHLQRAAAITAATALLGTMSAFIGASTVRAEEPKEVVITVQALSYSPKTIAIETGTTVIWRNAEVFDYPVADGTHRAAATDGSFDTGDLAPGQQYALPFLMPGTFTYKCVIHPSIMDGAITVTGEPIEEVKDVTISIVEPSTTDTNSWGFDPAKVTVAAGTTVTWRNNGAATHTVTAEDGSFDSKDLAPGKTFVKTFDEPAAFRYKCTPHPWMTGILSVAGKGGKPPPPPPPVSKPTSGTTVAPPVQQERGTDGGAVTLNVRIIEPSISDPQGWGFTPRSLNARKGDSVVWTNTGSVAHTVTASDGSFDSGDMATGATFRRVLDEVGTFTFACKPHPWMKGTLVVAAASAPRPVGAPVDQGIDGGSGVVAPGEETPSGTDSEEHSSAPVDPARRTLALLFGACVAALGLALIVPSLKVRADAATPNETSHVVALDEADVPLAETRELVGSGTK